MKSSHRTKCLNCSVDYFPSRNSFGLYCSNKCQANFQWGSIKQKIQRMGKVPNSKTGRRYLLEKCGHVCLLCSRRTWEGEPVPLVLDHINGNPYNWRLSNLRLICCNCDALTPTYKGRNRGNGRHYRRLRYQQGKSF